MIGCGFVKERAGMVVICYYPKAGSGFYMNNSSHATKGDLNQYSQFIIHLLNS